MGDGTAMPRSADVPGHAERDPQLAASLALCQAVAKRRARNFYYGLRLTPEPQRSAMYAIYAFMRACDDLADSEAAGGGDAAAQIERFRGQMREVLEDDRLPEGSDRGAVSLWPAFRAVVRCFPVPGEYLHAMLDGQKADLEKARYATFGDLYGYCYKVASVVGLVGISVWGYSGGEATRRMAEHRGVALQLTNILRDVAEDADRDRLYLPMEEVRAAGLEPETLLEDLRRRRESPALRELLAGQIARARKYYAQSAGLEAFVSPSGRSACWAIGRIYEGLLDKIARDPCRMLRRRVRLSSAHKAAIALRAVFQHRRRAGGPEGQRWPGGRGTDRAQDSA